MQPRWGAHADGDGLWSFGLWAPKARRVQLLLEGREIAMRSEAGVWSVRLPARAGMAYLFRIDGRDVPDRRRAPSLAALRGHRSPSIPRATTGARHGRGGRWKRR